MKMRIRKSAILLLIFGAFRIFAGEDDQRQDFRALYLFPYEVISREEMRLLDTETRLKIDPDSGVAIPLEREEVSGETEVGEPSLSQTDTEEEESGPKSLDTQIREAEGLLRRYYSQFLSEKRIWEDKNRGSKYSSKNEQNEIRLLILELQSRLTESSLIRDSEILYSLHRRLADLYSQKESYIDSLRHYVAAYRYRNRSHTEDAFLDESTWNEVLDEESLNQRNIHKSVRDSYQNQLRIYEEEKRKLHRMGSDYAQGLLTYEEYSGSKKKQELTIQTEKEKLEQLRNEYNQSYTVRYLPFQNEKSMEDAENLYKIANLVKIFEERNKERLKVVNKTSFAGRGVFVLFDYKRNVNFPAYEYLLELSYRMNPEYLPAIRDIAKQLRLDGKKLAALDFYGKLVNILEKKPEPSSEEKEELAEAYLNLGILNSDLKRKVIAAEFYEKFLNATDDEDKKKSLYFELGRFFENETGDLNKAREYYNLWLSANPDDRKNLTFAYYGLSRYERKKNYVEIEKNFLIKAYENYISIRQELDEKEKEIVNLEREINRYKRDLLLTTDDDSLAQYRILQLKMEDLKLERDKIRSDYSSIPKSRILLRLAEISEKDRNLNQAIQYYDELIQIGNESEVSHAVQNRKRLELTKEDGISRPYKSLY